MVLWKLFLCIYAKKNSVLLLLAQVERTESEKAGETWCSLRCNLSPSSSACSARIRYQEVTRAKWLTTAVHPTTNAIKEAGARTEFISSGLNMTKLNCLYFDRVCY